MLSIGAKGKRYLGVLSRLLAFGAIGALAPSPADAHFKITDPTTPPQPATVQSWMSQDSVGGPQKNGPCGAVPNTSLGDSPGTPVPNAVTVVQPGQTITVPVTITIGHPGWFRISLFEGPSASQTLTTLPDPKAQAGTNCTPTIMTDLVWSTTKPVLADGLPAGSTASTQQTGTKTFRVTIPSNASCSPAQPCALQVVMVMTDHPANDCYYHHCADVVVGSGTTDGGSRSGSGGSGGATVGSGGSTAGSGGATAGSGGSTAGSGGSAAAGGPGTSTPSKSSGCSCISAGRDQASWVVGAAGALALVIARRRPR
jgi:hypothetical protein